MLLGFGVLPVGVRLHFPTRVSGSFGAVATGPEALVEVHADTREQTLSRAKDESLPIIGVYETDADVAGQPCFP
jgi:hypothetical protein